MATLRFSTLHFRDVWLYSGGRKSLGFEGADAYGLSNPDARFYVMKGTIPTQSEFSAAASGFRNADILITKGVDQGAGAFEKTNDIVKMNSQIRTATQDGTASWFIWLGDYNSTGPAFLGTISLPGGGGDLSLTDVNIVSGQQYTIGPARFLFNQRDFTY